MIKTYKDFYEFLLLKINTDIKEINKIKEYPYRDILISKYEELKNHVEVLKDFQEYCLFRMPSKNMLKYFHKGCKEYESFNETRNKGISYYSNLLSWYHIILDKLHDFDIADYLRATI